MRLVCPNCAAEYEVDAALIPDEGRDVQCSNCGKMWFELPPNAVDEPPAPVVAAPVADAIRGSAADEADSAEWDDPAEKDTAEPKPQAEVEPEPAPEPTPATDDRPAPPSEDDAPAPIPRAATIVSTTPPEPKRREVDPKALDILKEEADRELATRRKEREAVEVQSEFDLTEEAKSGEPSRALRARMARLRGESDPRPQRTTTRRSETSDYRAPERELLPDIEEINSSLRPPNADPEGAEAANRADFRRGFGVMIGLAAFLIAIYIAAPAIARGLPGLEPAMTAYVGAANGFREMIDGFLR